MKDPPVGKSVGILMNREAPGGMAVTLQYPDGSIAKSLQLIR